MKLIKKLTLLLCLLSVTIVVAQSENTHYGFQSGSLGDYNSFFGHLSGQANTTIHNSFFGWQSGYSNTTGEDNVFFGSRAGYNNTTGHDNIFIGHYAGFTNTVGLNNVFLGTNSGQWNTTGNYNVFTGTVAGHANTTGSLNVFNGFESGRNNTTGSGNTFLGSYTGNSTTTGNSNTFVGSAAGSTNTTGAGNTFVGNYSGNKHATGHSNVFTGNYSGFKHTTGGNNIFLGNQSGYENISGVGNVFIGYKTGYNETGNDKLYIDNSNTDIPLIYGNFSSNQLGINTNIIPVGYTFAVKGNMIVEEVKVQVFPWSDFVFYDDYKLPSLTEVEQHIKEKGHLLSIPSAKEVAENGIKIGEMNAKLLQKIEELTLYTIQQEKQIQTLNTRLQNIETLLKTKGN